MVPTVGTKGKFTFLPPFDTKIDMNQEYQVEGVRTLIDLENSEESPYETIYKIVGMTAEEFNDDLINGVFIVTFKSAGCEYFYVPTDRISSLPQINGKVYQDLALGVALGLLPVDYDLDILKQSVVDTVRDITGITPTVTHMATSAKVVIDMDKHREMVSYRNNNTTVHKTYKTRYAEKVDELEKANTKIIALTGCIQRLKENG
jgi:hypothetical protein